MKPKIITLQPNIKKIQLGIGSSVNTERIRGWQLTKIRERILLRDEYTCQVCGRVSVNLIVDHKIPLANGGHESDENRQSLCAEPCHRLKSEKEEKERRQ
jgi:5-methylcytosine-specific restriction enzyme A